VKYPEYNYWFWSSFKRLEVEKGAVVYGPFFDEPQRGSSAPWRIEMFILFTDGQYIRICEYYSVNKKGEGHRNHLSFHYGPLPAARDDRGYPAYTSSEPVELRFDFVTYYHLHYKGPTHYPQDRIVGLKIADIDMFTFIRAVQEHRATGRELADVLHFEIK
jgi:hypothetical protein